MFTLLDTGKWQYLRLRPEVAFPEVPRGIWEESNA